MRSSIAMPGMTYPNLRIVRDEDATTAPRKTQGRKMPRDRAKRRLRPRNDKTIKRKSWTRQRIRKDRIICISAKNNTGAIHTAAANNQNGVAPIIEPSIQGFFRSGGTLSAKLETRAPARVRQAVPARDRGEERAGYRRALPSA